MPITPVDATSTASAGIPSSLPAHSASFLQMSMPCLPVHALAIPELTTTACAVSLVSTIFLSQRTGAAFTTLLVKVPALTQGTLLYTSAISILFLYLICASAPAASNPFAAVTPPSVNFMTFPHFLYPNFPIRVNLLLIKSNNIFGI